MPILLSLHATANRNKILNFNEVATCLVGPLGIKHFDFDIRHDLTTRITKCLIYYSVINIFISYFEES